MSVRKFKFVSPGVFVDEIDNSQLPGVSEDIGPVVIGRTERGPGLRPVKVNSFSEFVQIFGNPVPGGGGGDVFRDGNYIAPTYAAYAAQAWLKNASPLTVVRLLGTSHTDSTTAGSAGFQIGGSVSSDATAGGAYGLFLVDSGSAGDSQTGVLAAAWYLASGVVTLTGSMRGGSETTGSTATLISSAGADYEFVAEIYNGSGVLQKRTNFNFNENSNLYIRKVFNTNPTLLNSTVTTTANQETYVLGPSYERHVRRYITNTGAGGNVFGVILGLANSTAQGADFQLDARPARTGWFFSQDLSTDTASYAPASMTNLFRFHGINNGTWEQENLKISISEIKASTNDSIDPYGSFDVLVRRAHDTDNAVNVVERFSNCNLNPFSSNYIARKIGDEYVVWDDYERRYRNHGKHPNRSKFVRIEMNTDVDAAATDPTFLPFGFQGPVQFAGFTVISGSTSMYVSGSTVETLAAFAVGSTSLPRSGVEDASGQIVRTNTNGIDDEMDFTGSFLFPSFALRVSSSEGVIANPKDSYFGVTYNKYGGNTYDPSNKDIARALPSGYDSFATATATEISFYFTLDDLSGSGESGNPIEAVWSSGSRTSGLSLTAVSSSYLAVLDKRFDKFTVPLFGGFDGLDIQEKDPFRNTAIAGSETTNYEFNSIKRAVDSIADPEVADVNIITMPGLTHTGLTDHILNVAEQRADALAIIDLEGDYVPFTENNSSAENRAGNVDTTVDNLRQRGINTSYGCCYYPWVLGRDTINGATVWLPPSVAALGAMASAQKKAELWFAPAGFTRGGLSEGAAGIPIVNVAERLTSFQRDKLYGANINPIASFPAEGIVIFGQKTLQITQSALDRVNVRRLMNFVKKRISKIASRTLFEQNVVATWNNFLGKVEPFLEGVQIGLGLTDFKVILDESTTTPDLIDRNIMYAKIFLKPARAIEFIAIDFVISDSGAAFED